MGRGGAAPGGQRVEGAGNLRFLSTAEQSARALCVSGVYVRDLRRVKENGRRRATASVIMMHDGVHPLAKRKVAFSKVFQELRKEKYCGFIQSRSKTMASFMTRRWGHGVERAGVGGASGARGRGKGREREIHIGLLLFPFCMLGGGLT